MTPAATPEDTTTTPSTAIEAPTEPAGTATLPTETPAATADPTLCGAPPPSETPVAEMTEVPASNPTPTKTPQVMPLATISPTDADSGQGGAATCRDMASSHADTAAPDEAERCDDPHDAVAPLAIAPTADSLSSVGSETGDADHGHDPVADTGDLLDGAPGPRETSEPTTELEPSITPQPAGEADEPADGTKRQKRTNRGDDGPGDLGAGDQHDPTVLADPVEPTREDQAVDDQPLPEERRRGPAGKKRRKADKATVVAGDTPRGETVQVDAGETTDRRTDTRHDLEAGGNSEPEARPTHETAPPSSQDDRPARGKKRGLDTRARYPAGRGDDGGQDAYRVDKTHQSANSVDAAVVVDGDATTAWHTEPGATSHAAWVVLDLGTSRSIGTVRWLVAPDGLAGTLRVEVSTDGQHWKKAAEVAKEATAGWQELRLKHALDAQYVRFTFSKPSGDPRLGGLAEVEIRPAVKPQAQRDGPTPERHRGPSGQAPAQPGQERTTSGTPPPAHKDRTKQQDPQHDQATSSEPRKPDPEQGKDRNKGQERKKPKAKSSPHRAPQERGA
jgi:hypothetical protein